MKLYGYHRWSIIKWTKVKIKLWPKHASIFPCMWPPTDMCKNTHGPPQTTSILALLLSLSFGSFSILLLLLEWFLQSPWPEIHGRSMGPYLKKTYSTHTCNITATLYEYFMQTENTHRLKQSKRINFSLCNICSWCRRRTSRELRWMLVQKPLEQGSEWQGKGRAWVVGTFKLYKG